MITRLERIESYLKVILPLYPDRSWVDRIAGEEIEDPDLEQYQAFCQPASDLVNRGGKRWRPLLMVLTAEAAGGPEAAERAYPLTAVVEFPHNGSLIIDDIEDSSEWRRGEKAVHTIYGTDISINAGNLLYFLPTVSIDSAALANEQKLAVYQIYSRYMRRVHLGQGLDIHWHRNPEIFPQVGEYLQMCRFKTGCLAGMSAEIGAAAAGWKPERTRIWGRTAEKIGVGFQIRDDVENLHTGNPGKRHGDDIVEGKKSLPVILHLRECPEDIFRMTELFAEAARKGVDGAKDEIDEAVAMIAGSSALDKAEAMGEKLLHEALEEVSEIFEPSPARDQLTSLVEKFIR